MTSTIRVVAAAAVVLFPHGAAAQLAVAPPPYTLVVWGDATVSAAPDRARIDIRVTTRAESARQAASTNAAQADRLIAALKNVTGITATIATAAYSVRPEYRYPREGAEPQITGYVATNTVRVETAALDHVGRIIDAAVASGTNTVQQVDFVLKDEQQTYANALRQAAERARAEAGALATALGVKVFRILTAAEEPIVDPAPRPFAVAARAADAALSTPVQPGTIDVRARVRLTVEFTDR